MTDQTVSEIGHTWDIRPCLTCGKVHEMRETGPPHPLKPWGTWESPDDGHIYQPQTWQGFAMTLWNLGRWREGES